jgi:hypothetical protein
MGRKVDVSLEVFGDQRIVREYDRDDLKGKSVGDIIKEFDNASWIGEERRVAARIRKELNSTGGYSPQVDLGGYGNPTSFEPVRIGDPLEKYIEETPLPKDEVRVTVLGDHTVGDLTKMVRY